MAQEPGFQIRPLERRLSGGRPLYWTSCVGSCDRAKRPLACRIFPLTPYVIHKGIIITEIDPRAKPVCPLAEEHNLLEPDFRRRVGKVCRQLGREPEIREFLEILTREIDEYRRLAEMFVRSSPRCKARILKEKRLPD